MIDAFRVLEFRFPWRSYQDKLLQNFYSHIADKHFHVIAPPGSGKTILGIEILRRLGKKTLVLAPTITIRNQWLDRLQTFFTDDTPFLETSLDIKTPNTITFSTYQSLHSFYKSFENKDDFLEFFKKHNIETIVLDEAHHLKNAWWTCLIALKKSYPFFIVALTATPPYDSSRLEINKYFTLCGEVDDEICVPDLIRENDLSPHQDFVYFSKPYDSELNFINDYRNNIAEFKSNLLLSENFINLLKAYRLYQNPQDYLDEIYSNTAFFSSILIALNEVGIRINKEKMQVLGIETFDKIRLPKLDLHWFEILLQNLLVEERENLIEHEDFLSDLEKKLRRLHGFEKNKVNLTGNETLYRSLAFSPSKLESIVEIVNAERLSLQDDLSCVILTDYIRKEFLNTSAEDVMYIDKIGVLPIFHYIRTSSISNKDLAVLTGSLVIIHHSRIRAVNGLKGEEFFNFSPLKSDEDFVKVNVSNSSSKAIVSIMTQLFEEGIIKVLIGTKALLGEGWDAPSINSLILASFVGSFVSSNQMRGRAIRIDANNSKKTSNIWHLACIDPTDIHGGKEVELLKRRFSAFLGITNTTIPFISDGYERLGIPETINSEDVDDLNAETLNYSAHRTETYLQWKQSIGRGTKLTRQIQLEDYKEPEFKAQRSVFFAKATQLVVLEIFLILFIFLAPALATILELTINQKLSSFIKFIGFIAVLYFGYRLYKLVVYYLRHGFLHTKIKRIGLAILQTMDEIGIFITNKKNVQVHSEKTYGGAVNCTLKGATNYE
ncbi:DEAD/DEAH box helicase family protein [Winogradskyella litorisediminis]|uniref:DEAD/DEAH box helicase family protein n=1 Tax=Winogradskyella litorisediminis TaxID=1156618 RepID=A0ABW3N484_9FLAO